MTHLENHPERAVMVTERFRHPQMKFRIRRLFDTKFYLDSNPDVRDGHLEPWQHFCQFGHRENRDPHPVFRTGYYRKLHMGNRYSENPLIHYLRQSNSMASTHPLFDAEFYYSQVFEDTDSDSASQLENQSLLEHFLAYNHVNLASPSVLFDTRAYVNANPELSANSMNALYHYCRFGVLEQRESFINWQHIERLRFLSDQQLNPAVLMIGQHARLAIDITRLNRNAQTILCVSQFATASDSAFRAIQVSQRLREVFHVNVVHLLCENGPLCSEFLKIGPTFSLKGSDPTHQPHLYVRRMRQFKSLIRLAPPNGILTHSVTSAGILADLAELEVPISALVHENVTDVPLWQLNGVNELCDRIIFPSHVARQKALENSSLDPTRIDVIQPGIFEQTAETRGSFENRSRLEIAANAILVLGCGDESAAMGLDLFVSIAISALHQDANNTLHFAWIGNSDDPTGERLVWAKTDVEMAGFDDRILFLGNDQPIEAIIQCCDIFLLATRSDAFPTSVMQAMSAGKPVVLFNRGNGIAQLVTKSGGFVVSYGDTAAAATAIYQLARDASLREKQGNRNREIARRELDFGDYVTKLMMGIEPESSRDSEVIGTRQSGTVTFTRKRRVVFCSPSWSVSGVNTFVEELGRQLVQRGFDVSILFTTMDSVRLPDQHLPNLPYHYLSNLTLEEPDRREKILSYLKSQEPLVVIPNFDYVASSITPILPDHIRILGILHSDQDEHYLHAYRMGHYWDRIITVSSTIRRRLLNINPGLAAKTELIRYGIPIGPVNQKELARQRNSNPIRLVYTGRLVQQQKRILDFVELAGCLDRREIDFRLTIIGEGEDQAELTSRMQTFIARGQVRLPGRLSRADVYRELKRHHAFCLLSDYEGLPLSMLEAMATECVPVVTKIESGISEILTHYRNAMLSPMRNVEAMADNVQLLHDDILLRKRLGMRARTTLFRHRLTIEQMADAYARILNAIHDEIESGAQRAPRMPLDCPVVQRALDAA